MSESHETDPHRPAPHLERGGFSHVCFAVPDLESAMEELTRMTGVTFGEPLRDRMGEWSYSLVFSREAPHIELISSVAGSPWEADVPRFHHLGWWSSCLPETLEAWTGDGGTMYLDGRDHGRQFAYVDAPRSGARLEAVDVTRRDSFQERWA